ncbi:MAG: hypothetical protein WBQ21_11265 [Solirubrobacteraceae bacterium]
MSGLKIVKINKVTFTTSDPLERDKIGERANRCLYPINSTRLGTGAELSKAERRSRLG